MGRKRHKPEEIIAKLRQVDVLTAQGMPVVEAIAKDWLARKKWSAVHRKKSERALERDVFPYIGRLPVGAERFHRKSNEPLRMPVRSRRAPW